jgi:hypothetical protein
MAQDVVKNLYLVVTQAIRVVEEQIRDLPERLDTPCG